MMNTAPTDQRQSRSKSYGKADLETGKVGFVIGSLMRGGAELHLAQLLPELKQRGWDVSVFLIGPSGPVAEYLDAANIKISPKRSIRVAGWLPVWLRRAIRFLMLSPSFLFWALGYRQGIVHFFLPEAFIIGGLLAFPWHRRLIMSRRGLTTYRAKYPAFVITLERYLQEKMLLLSANSKAVVEEMLLDGVAKEKIRLIYNGLAPDRIDAPTIDRVGLREKLGISDSALVIVKLANLHPYKGHMELLEALSYLHLTNQLSADWVLLLIGRDVSLHGTEVLTQSRPGYQAILEAACEKSGLSRHVRFLGERSDAPALLRCADIGVLSSHEEGFSNALLEMMAAGLGIVATDVGGNREALNNGQAGQIVPPKDSHALGAALAQLIADPDKRREFSKKARSRVLENYTIKICADRYEDVYREMLKS